MTENGQPEQTQERLEFPCIVKEDEQEASPDAKINEDKDETSSAESLVFAIDFGNGEIQQLSWRPEEGQAKATRTRKVSL